MKYTRKTFLGASAIGLLGMATKSSEAKPNKPIELCDPSEVKPFVFGNEPLRTRKSFYDLSDNEVKNLCKAVGYMRNQIPLGDPLHWETYTKMHSKHCTSADEMNPQVHWGWHFLPWHRAYIFFLERILANILRNNFDVDNSANFAYPYWDWVNHKEMPNTKERELRGLASPLFGYDLTQQNMVKGDNLGFDNLALYNGNRGPTIEKNKMTPDNETQPDSKQHIQECINFMSPEYVKLMLTTPWEQFGGKPVIDKVNGPGLLESGAHNDGHDWVGTRYGCNRDMGTLRYAALDPIFFMHHGNIDRIWSLYKNEMPDVNGPWGQQVYVFPDLDGTPVSVTIKDIVLWMNTVSYQAPSVEKTKLLATRPTTSMSSVSMKVNKRTSAKAGLTVAISPNEELKSTLNKGFQGGISMLEVETGPISHKGKASIQIYVNKTYIGRIKIMDGDPSTTNANVSHTFVMTIGKLGNLIDVLSTNSKFDLNFYLYGLDKDVLIRSLKFSVIE